MGARGNSGVILSQILRGLADTFRAARRRSRRADLAHGLRARGRRRVPSGDAPGRGHDPHRRARGGRGGRETLDGDALVGRARARGRRRARRRSRARPSCSVLPRRRRRRRGRQGLHAAARRVARGRRRPADPRARGRRHARRRSRRTSRGDDVVGPALRGHVPPRRARRRRSPAFKEAWSAIGDSIVVVGGDGLWNCHVHTNDIGAAIEAGIDAGRPRRSASPTCSSRSKRSSGCARPASSPIADAPMRAAVTTAVVAVGVGDGVRRLLTSLGVQHVVAGGQSMNPSTAQILEAVEACNADAVIVLPNNKNIVPVAQQVDALTREARSRSCRPLACPRRSPRSSTTTRTPTLDDERATRCSGALERVRTGEVTQAVRDAIGECGPITRRRLDRARRATASSPRPASPGRRGVQAARRARRRRQRDRHGARRRRRAGGTRPQRIREHLEFDVPARRGRVPRRRPAALPVPRRVE